MAKLLTVAATLALCGVPALGDGQFEAYPVPAAAGISIGVDSKGAKDPRKCKSYDYTESGKALRLTIPESISTVRGVLVVGPGAGGDSREFYREAWYGEFLYLHDFAFLGTESFSSHAEDFRVMQNALKQFAKDSRHPELVNVPYAATGFSAGGGFASRLLVESPDRVIASVPVCARLKLTDITPNAAHLGTPACVISGEFEQEVFVPVVEPVLAEYRPKGALFGWMAVPGGGHSRMGQEVLAMPLLDAAVRLRYPADGDVQKGPVKLKALDPASGWIADNTTWRSGLTTIVPANDFKGDIKKSSWLGQVENCGEPARMISSVLWSPRNPITGEPECLKFEIIRHGS